MPYKKRMVSCMKKLYFIVIILSSSFITSIDQDKITTAHYVNFNSSYNLLVEQSAAFIKNNAGMIAAIPFSLYYHQDVLRTIQNHPYVSSYWLYLLLHYLCDCMIEYQQEQSFIHLTTCLKKTAVSLLVCHGLKNYIEQKNRSQEWDKQSIDIYKYVTKNTSFSFEQIEIILMKTYKELKQYFASLPYGIKIESEEFAFLCYGSSMNIQTLYYITQNDLPLHQALYEFEHNQAYDLITLLNILQNNITNNLMLIEQYLLTEKTL